MSYLSEGTPVNITSDAKHTNRNGSSGVLTRVDLADPDLPYKVTFDNGDTEWFEPNEVVSLTPAVTHPEIPLVGMTSVALAEYAARTIEAVTGRITGVGHDQYSTVDGQQFEGMTVDALFQYAREEAQDLIAYGVMLDIKLARIQSALNSKVLGKCI